MLESIIANLLKDITISNPREESKMKFSFRIQKHHKKHEKKRLTVAIYKHITIGVTIEQEFNFI